MIFCCGSDDKGGADNIRKLMKQYNLEKACQNIQRELENCSVNPELKLIDANLSAAMSFNFSDSSRRNLDSLKQIALEKYDKILQDDSLKLSIYYLYGTFCYH